MTTVILGPNGLVGSALVSRGGIPVTADICDYADLTAGLLSVPNVTAIVNCAGYTHVDGCETRPADSYLANVHGVNELVETLRIWYDPPPLLVQLSSDFIFDGRNGPYDEDAFPAPLSVYGAQKYLAESLVRQYPRHLIVRTTCVFGRHPKKYTFVHWVLDQLRQGQPFDVAGDEHTTPTYNVDLARSIESLIAQDVTGIVNVTCGHQLSRYQFARKIAEAFGLDTSLITPGHGRPGLARRPALGGLFTTKLNVLGIHQQPLENSLQELAASWD